MVKRHEVRKGECLSLIAKRYGWEWKALWDHADNAELRALRKDPNILYPGDVVVIPDKRPGSKSGGTDQRHCFSRKGVPSKLRVRLLENGRPIAGRSYEIEIDGAPATRGSSDGDGWIEQSIKPDARKARLALEGQPPYELGLGELDPSSETSGVQGRLYNLGYLTGEVSGRMDELTRLAIAGFQARAGLPATGTPDDATRAKLDAEYGC